MPRDCKGNELRPGDVVIFRAEVKHVTPHEDGINASFELLNPLYSDEYTPLVACNARLCVKTDPFNVLPDLHPEPPMPAEACPELQPFVAQALDRHVVGGPHVVGAALPGLSGVLSTLAYQAVAFAAEQVGKAVEQYLLDHPTAVQDAVDKILASLKGLLNPA